MNITRYPCLPIPHEGLTVAKDARERDGSTLENQTVVAVLFAWIATSMIQTYSGVTRVDDTAASFRSSISIETANVTLWYTCLILSISSAANGLLGLSWLQAI